MSTLPSTTCRHCDRAVIYLDGVWIDPRATGDDEVWRETCDAHDTFTAEHEPALPVNEPIRAITMGDEVQTWNVFRGSQPAELVREWTPEMQAWREAFYGTGR